jgi:Ca2+-transporting ATPase
MIVSHVFADNKIYTVSGKGYYPQGSLFFESEPVSIGSDTNLYTLAQALSLLNTTTLASVSEQGTFDIKGDPTEAALFVFAQKVGIDVHEIEQEFKKVYEIPFGAEHKYHAGFFLHNNQGVAFIAGSPELIMHLDGQSALAQEAFWQFLSLGLRIIGIGTKKFDPASIPSDSASEQQRTEFFQTILANNITFLGLCGIEDSIRAEAASTISNARKAGLHIIMATGDHQRTALSIAKQVGIYQDGDEALDGPEFDALSDQQLKDLVIHTTVFSRVTPEQKLRIIAALHAHGLIVAMTGDGINDAPSLVAADIGIGMGAIGTEVAKEASDIVLLDDSVINIIHAIEEGRHTIYTLRRVVLYFFSTNLAEILIILFAFVFSLLYPSWAVALPLTAAQILWLNLVTDGFLDSALSLEEKEKKILFEREWLLKRHRLIDARILRRVFFAAIPMAIGSLFVFLLYSPIDIMLARTMALVTLGMFQWFNAWNCRSDVQSVFQLGLLSNPWLVLATILVFVLQLALLHVPLLQRIFATQPLNIYQWIFIALIASSILWIEEIRKWFVRKNQH